IPFGVTRCPSHDEDRLTARPAHLPRVMNDLKAGETTVSNTAGEATSSPPTHCEERRATTQQVNEDDTSVRRNTDPDAMIATLIQRLAVTEAELMRERASNEAMNDALVTFRQQHSAAAESKRNRDNPSATSGATPDCPQDMVAGNSRSTHSSAPAMAEVESSESLRGDYLGVGGGGHKE
ncbi:unnamed protein product, partial [Sphacelaria rigidula]